MFCLLQRFSTGNADRAGAKKSKKRGKVKRKARGVDWLLAPWWCASIAVFSWDKGQSPILLAKFLFSSFLTVHIHNRKPFKYLNLLIQVGFNSN